MKILGDRILVKPIALETSSIIQLPGDSNKTPAFGCVLQLGNGKNIDSELRVGSLVRIDENYGSQRVNGHGFIVSTRDVLAVVTPD